MQPTPSFSALLAEWAICDQHLFPTFCGQCAAKGRMFRVFVEYLRQGKTKTDLENRLTPTIRKRYLQNRPKGLSSFTLNTQGGAIRLHKNKTVNEDYGIPEQMLSLIPKSEDPASFHEWLLLAWFLRDMEHRKAERNKDFKQALTNLVERGLEKNLLLNLTFLPEELVQNGRDLRNFMKHLREDLSLSIRSYKQKIRMNPHFPLKGPTGEDEEEPASRAWEKRWLEQFGLEKNTGRISQQYIWTWLFVPLVDFLLPYAIRRKQEHWRSSNTKPIDPSETEYPILPDDVFKKASQLLHLRYPKLWEDKWLRVRVRTLPYVSF
jgi:hypothetical protein